MKQEAEAHEFTLDEIQQDARAQVQDGFTPLAEIEGNLIERFELADSDPRRALLGAMVAEEIREQRRQQATWPDDTDCDRLDRAFAWLESIGVVARQHFTCCSPCGHGEIHDEIAEAQQRGHLVRGYTFYHLQDTERAVQGQGIFLKYGVSHGGASDEDCAMIARMVVAALRDAGLRVDWSGSAQQAIRISLDWQKRRPQLCSPG